jgi:hypothetical protein
MSRRLRTDTAHAKDGYQNLLRGVDHAYAAQGMK